jgi:predicted amidohydrolase YtcJ
MRTPRTGLVLLAGFSFLSCGQDRPAAELVIQHAAIYTGEPGDSGIRLIGSVAVGDGRILYVGPDSGAAGLIGPGTEVVDGTGRMLLPGFVDAHVHPYSGAELLECDLSADSTPAQLLRTITGCSAANPGKPWFRASGWQLPIFPGANPAAALLDQVVADRPAYLVAADGHSAWVNSRALELAGITARTPNPEGGHIERDAAGAPTGTLRENAMALVGQLLPEYSIEDYEKGFRLAFEMANSLGITAMVDADADSTMLETYWRMDSIGALPVRITAAQSLHLEKGSSQVVRVIRFRDRYRGRLLEAGSAKIYLDGVIETRTAALLAPYLDRPGDRGGIALEQPALDSLIVGLDRAGIQVHVHAIGDRAIRSSLDAFARARTVNRARDSRHMIAHIQLFDSTDIGRFAELGVIANFQPLWAYDDAYIVDLTIPALGPVRARWLYPIGSMLRSGAVVVAGSDWSVSSMNPLEAIQVALTRRAPDAGPGEGWIPEERASLDAMLRAYTFNGAYARFADSVTGSLREGKLADLVLLERNLFEIPPHEIGKTRILLTVLDGRVVYRNPSP